MWLEDLARDIRCGFRGLRREPLFASVAVLTLAFGIGANTAIFSLADAVLLRALPVSNPTDLLFSVTIAVLVIAPLAAYAPARRASRIDPLAAIKHEQ